ncbi:NlpC/P60 family protein [Streptomyces violens]|uniref:NlpC/P60 family protein n=1 Tax=Streptomyces violens TaxID=66377 RepID=UPI000689C3D4|nr:NlpC/P60 family protein [Streptomyces violens]
MSAAYRKTHKNQHKKRRPLLHTVTVLALLAAGAYLTVELREREQAALPPLEAVTDGAVPAAGAGRHTGTGRRHWERLRHPDRSVLRGAHGEVLATFTDGARTAALKGPSRVFTEPATTASRVVTEDWVRLLPKQWRQGAEKERWFQDWFGRHYGSEQDDILAMGFQYVDRAPVKKDAKGVAYAGDAAFGPLNPHGSLGNDLREEKSDFYDYLGIPYTYRDGVTARPEAARYHAVDCSGFIRLLYGYRAHYPLRSRGQSGGGLPRISDAMARSAIGADVIPPRGGGPGARPASIDVLQPGDLVFFELDARTGARLDHVGVYVGHDSDGHKIFLSSREEANGPTVSGKGGVSWLDGDGYYAERLRSAKRL